MPSQTSLAGRQDLPATSKFSTPHDPSSLPADVTCGPRDIGRIHSPVHPAPSNPGLEFTYKVTTYQCQ